MSEPTKDTLTPAASPEIPAQVETPTGEQTVTSNTASAPEGKPEKVYAGKYKSPDDLETAYKSLESKLGSKTYSEKLGEQVVKATGFSVTDLEQAGYTPDQIAEAVVQSMTTGTQQAPQSKPALQPKTQEIANKVENSKLEQIEFKDKMRDFFETNPDAKEFRDEIMEWHDHPKFKHLSPDEIYSEKLSKFISKGSATVYEKQSVKEKANLTVSNITPPQAKDSDKAAKAYIQTGHLDDAAKFIASRLAERGK